MIGCWRKTEIVRTGMTPIPENIDGIIYIATNERILVGVEGTDLITRKDIGGYYALHKTDLSTLLKMNRNLTLENNELKKKLKE